jgi:aminopeptidase C
MKLNVFAILNVATIFVTSLSLAEVNKCISSYKEYDLRFEVQRNLDQKYAEQFLVKNLDKKFDVKWVSNLSPIQNQKNWGFCHLYSFFTEVNREYMQRHNGKDPEVSIHYMAFHHWLGRSIETALNPQAKLKPTEGGWYIYDIDLFKKIGSMKLSEYLSIGGKTDVEEKLTKFLEDSILTSTISRMHDQQNLINEVFKTNFSDKELALLAKDVSSGSSQEVKIERARMKYNQTLFSGANFRRVDSFKSFVADKRKAFEANQTSLTSEQLKALTDLANGKMLINNFSKNEIKAIKDAVENDVKKEVTRLFASFFFGKDEVPFQVMDTDKNVKLAKEMFPEINQATISYSVNEEKVRYQKSIEIEQKPDAINKHTYLATSLPTLYKIIADNVERKNNGVWIGYDHNDTFVSNKINDVNIGLMSIRAHSWAPESPYLSRYDRFQKKGIVAGGHAVQIVGTIREKVSEEQALQGIKGDIIAFIIQNSWGKEAGQEGFYIMDKSYADAFLFGITVRDEPQVVEQHKKAIEMIKAKMAVANALGQVGFKAHIKKEKQIQEEIKSGVGH